MKKLFAFLFLFTAIYSFSQTSVPGGNVSGTWTQAGSPYQIQGSIQIPNGQTLTINPGVTVEFQGTYKLDVQGRLIAMGTSADTIVFTAANTTNGWRGIRFDNTPTTNDTSKIKYCKVQYGKATGSSPYDNGGALYFNSISKVVVSNCRIDNCTATTCGGGIYSLYSSPSIINNTICNNSAAADGGGIFCFYAFNGIDPIISTNTVSNNSTNSYGGGIYCQNNNSIVSNNIIFNNTSGYGGGGISCFYDSTLLIDNSIYNNNATGGGGGGIHCENSNATITNNTILNNSTTQNGGGIYCYKNNPTISENIIANNNAVSDGGGGIYCHVSSPTILGNIISNNVANDGGGIYCNGSNSTFTNNAVVNNGATNGGAIYCNNASNPIFRNTILWGNTAGTSGTQVFLNDELSDPDFYYCDVQGGSGTFGINGNSYLGIYQNNIDADPKFVSPSGGSGTGFNGATADWSLQSSSPCIDNGDPSGTYPATDIADNPRVTVCRIDMGAYEYNTGVPLSTTITQTQQIICNGDATASLTANPLGGAPSDTYSYLWSNGSTLQSISGLLAGVHSVTVSTTIAQCQVALSYTVNESSQIVLSPSHIDDNACNAINDGWASINVTGGEIPYTYQWGNGNSTSAISGLTVGNYSLTVTDNIGCVHTNTITIGSLSTIITPNLTSAPDTCTGSVGAVTAAPSGGLGAYTFAWSNGSSAQNIFGLNSGNYSVTITDSLGCLITASPVVGIYMSPIIPTLTSIPDTCIGNVGSAISNPIGGTNPFNYLWSNNGTNQSIIGLAPGNFTVTVTDKNGCFAVDSISVASVTSTVTISFTPVSASCQNADGSLTANPSGGITPYNYVWSNSSSAQTVNNLLAGNYTVNVTDKNGCAATDSSTVGTSNAVSTPAICMVTVDSLSKNNVIMWDKTSFAHVDSFIVYREVAVNNYQPIGAVPYDSLSLFVDTVRTKYFPNTGDPNAGTYRYKLGMRDSCGNISTMSAYHNTIYILNNSGAFSWTQHYTIENASNPVTSYILMRDDLSNGNWHAINSVSGTQQTIIDPNFLTYQNTGSWRVETQWSISCNPTRIMPNTQSFNASRSNIYSLVNGVHEYYNNPSISISPNPSEGEFTVYSSLSAEGSFKIYDLFGKEVFKATINAKHQTLNPLLASGMYFYKLAVENTIISTGKLIIK